MGVLPFTKSTATTFSGFSEKEKYSEDEILELHHPTSPENLTIWHNGKTKAPCRFP